MMASLFVNVSIVCLLYYDQKRHTMETLINNDAIMIMLKKYLLMNYLVSYERLFIGRKIRTVLTPWKIVPQKNIPNPNP